MSPRTNPLTTLAAAVFVSLFVAVSTQAGCTVWNVNVGSGASPIITGDDYQGAASENTANSTWNEVDYFPFVSEATSVTLADSTGSASAGVTFTVTPDAGSQVDFGGAALSSGDKIFTTWIKDGDGDGAGPDGVNDDPYTITFGNLNSSAPSYSLVIYSNWYWGPNVMPVELAAGTGLSGTFYINSPGGDGIVGPLLEDTNPANVAGEFNYARFNGLQADGSGNLSLTIGVNGAGANNFPTNGFQLIEIPEPSTAILAGLGLMGVCFRRRRS